MSVTRFNINHAGALVYLGCKQNLGHPVNDLFELRTGTRLGMRKSIEVGTEICVYDFSMATMRDMMTKLKLTVNEKKTRVCKLPEEKFDFLGYTFCR